MVQDWYDFGMILSKQIGMILSKQIPWIIKNWHPNLGHSRKAMVHNPCFDHTTSASNVANHVSQRGGTLLCHQGSSFSHWGGNQRQDCGILVDAPRNGLLAWLSCIGHNHFVWKRWIQPCVSKTWSFPMNCLGVGCYQSRTIAEGMI